MVIHAVLLTVAACLADTGDAKDAKKPAEKNKLSFSTSKETTYVLGPKDDAGYIDYFAALNERLSKGVTPENNANVLLFRAIGPRPEGAAMPAGFFKLLGMEEPPPKGEYLVEVLGFLKQEVKDFEKREQALNDEIARIQKRPWKSDEFPHFAAWLKANEKPLDLTVQATRRTEYFLPLLSNDAKKSGLIGALLPSPQKCRQLAYGLCTRAMLRLGEGRVDDARQDLLACHRLGRLVGRGGTLIEGLVGIAIDAIASEADLAYLGHAKLGAKQIQDRLSDLEALPSLPSFADKIELTERFMFLDAVMMLDARGIQFLESLVGDGNSTVPTLLVKVAMANIELDPALKKANKYYDRLSAAMRLEDFETREVQFDKINAELKKLRDPKSVITLVFGGKSGKERGEILGDILLSLLLPATQKVNHAGDRAEQIQRNLHVAFALEAFQREQGRYPTKLAELSPKYLKTVPTDLFSGKDLIYRPDENGYLLHSIGVNRKDEAGRWHDDAPPGDDPRVRMPLPKLEK